MALISAPTPLIVIPVSDRAVLGTRLKQQARFIQLRHSQDEAGLCAAYIDVEITMYAAAADGDGYGPELTAEGFLRRQKTLVADNNTVV
ncbi:hypothetical protein, partial [Hymenobacter terricola]|uniref:hypothetical protein n=1 Tax=Hymenobacter terricola TaxID=2819236 RepID=UPI001B311A9B